MIARKPSAFYMLAGIRKIAEFFSISRGVQSRSKICSCGKSFERGRTTIPSDNRIIRLYSCQRFNPLTFDLVRAGIIELFVLSSATVAVVAQQSVLVPRESLLYDLLVYIPAALALAVVIDMVYGQKPAFFDIAPSWTLAFVPIGFEYDVLVSIAGIIASSGVSVPINRFTGVLSPHLGLFLCKC